ARHFLDLLDTARCNGNWSEIPELVRKLGKHAPERKCLQLTAQAEFHLATTTSKKPATTSSSIPTLSKLAPGLLSASQAATDFREDAFQAHVCLGWLHWTMNEPMLALQSLPENIPQAYNDVGRAGKTISGWTTICAIKAALIQGELQDDAGKTQEAHRTYASMLPLISSTTLASRSLPEYRIWTERLLARYSMLMQNSPGGPQGIGSQPRFYTKQTLAPFRAWAELPWTDSAQSGGNIGQPASSITLRTSTRRRVWQLYYNALSAILQRGLPYPPVGHEPSTSAQTNTGNVESSAGLKLQQSLELRRVENIYEDILLKEVPFPKADEANAEVESWTDQVVANWRVISNSSWQNEDLGKGGKEAMTRNVLAILYRAATRTFHSTRVLRHLFTVHTALAEFNLAAKALDTYIDLVAKGKARVDKSGEDEVGLDDDSTVLKATAAGLEMLCLHGRRKHVERAQEIAAVLEKWLEHIEDSLEPTINADDNPKDLQNVRRKPRRPVAPNAIAAAHRSLGICRAYWARLTYDISIRPGLQAKAIASFRTGLVHTMAPSQRGDINYALAVLLAETRDIDGAIQSVKATIARCTDEMGEDPSEDQGDMSDPEENRRKTLLFKAWHLLAYLLSARQNFATAVASCEAAYEFYDDLTEQSGKSRLTERLSLAARERILEIKMSQVALSEILDGPEEAVNAGGDLLGLYKQLFDYEASNKPAVPPAVLDTRSPPQTANGTLKSTRRSIFGRSKDAVGHIPHGRHLSSNGQRSVGTQRGAAENPTISVSIDGQVDGSMHERRYQPPHHLARQESKKLHKRHSRKSIASGHRGRGTSTNRSSYANGMDESVQALPTRIAEMTRPSMESSYGGSSAESRRLSSEEVGLAVTHNVSQDQNRDLSNLAKPSRSFSITAQSTHKDQNPSAVSSKPPPSQPSIPVSESSHSYDSLPDPMYSPTDLNRRALTLLNRIWLLIAKLYRNAAMP
ncbi:MAG: hypothetical protein Q9180_005651, partial [Flavoplaca navasiana]